MSTPRAETPPVTGRARLGPDELLMPSPKLRADQYLLVLVNACSAVDPVDSVGLSAATGIAAKNCGLVPVFAMNSGLLVKGHRRATYLPSEKGRYVARAFKRGEAEGLAAIRNKWKGQWFARAVKDRCRYGPVSREALVAKLLTAARAGSERIKRAHILLDLMVAVGLVTVEESGELHWFEGVSPAHAAGTDPHSANISREEARADDSAEESPTGEALSDTTEEASDRAGHEERSARQEGPEMPEAEVPRPRTEAPAQDQALVESGVGGDLLSLLLPPILLADLTRLTQAEVLELHSHLTAVTALTAKLRGHRVT
ncbi:hypothetical protein [Streptomyces sp. NPDC006785]|uniref:hypothetical protein n=1 Tax=Streptomyces sp. NPDC006785 TaxID=3155461 RepID=UPI0033C75096